jgi:hypothetical protein
VAWRPSPRPPLPLPRPRLPPKKQALKDCGWSLEAIEAFFQANPQALRRAAGRGAPDRRERGKPPPLLALVRGCATLADLKDLVAAQGHAFDGRAAAAAIARVPKLSRPAGAGEAATSGSGSVTTTSGSGGGGGGGGGSSSLAAERMLDRLVPALMAAVAGAGAAPGAAELAAALCALGRAGYPLGPEEGGALFGALEGALRARSGGGGGQVRGDLAAASLAATAAAHSGADRGPLWDALLGPALEGLRAATAARPAPGQMPARPRPGKAGRARGGGGAPVLPTGPDALALAAAAERSTSRAAAAAAAASPAAALAWAHARVGRAPGGLASALSEYLTAGGGARLMASRELTNMAKAAAAWAKGAGGGGDGGGGGGVARLSDSAVLALLDTAAERLWQFSSAELDALLGAVAALGVTHPPLEAAVAKHLDTPAAAAGAAPATLAAALSAAARAGSDGGREVLAAAAGELAAAPEKFTPAEAADVAWAAAAMGVRDEGLLSAALGRVAAASTTCGPRALTHALLGSCATRDAATRGGLIAAVAPAAAAQAGGFSARDAGAALRVLAASHQRGEVPEAAAASVRAATAALGARVLEQWRAGAVLRGAAADAAVAVAAACGADHEVAAALRAVGEEPPAGGAPQQPRQH